MIIIKITSSSEDTSFEGWVVRPSDLKKDAFEVWLPNFLLLLKLFLQEMLPYFDTKSQSHVIFEEKKAVKLDRFVLD